MRCVTDLLAPTGLALAGLALSLAACATGGDVSGRGQDASRRDGGAGRDASSEICDPPCPEGEMCEGGGCVPTSDADGDGIPAERDCDDADLLIGRMAERPCSSGCSDGVERCTDGLWSECTAPAACACDPATPPRMVACAHCGTQRQVCRGGTWTNEGACTEAGPCGPGDVEEGGSCGNCGTQRRTCADDCAWGAWACEGEGTCAAGATESETRACGECGAGVETRTRTCSTTSCGWDAWSAWGACEGASTRLCTAGAVERETRACGPCGTGSQERTRRCDAAGCAFGAWGAWGACVGGGACAPGETRACPNGDSCGVQTCGSTCAWPSVCTPNPGSECLRIQPGTSGPAGNNYRCCTRSGSDPTGWQFCLPPDAAGRCFWSTTCAATTSC